MIRLERILIPTDFSETSQAAMKCGVALARAFKAQLYLLHVPEPGEAAAVEHPIGLADAMQNPASEQLSALLTDKKVAEFHPECILPTGKRNRPLRQGARGGFDCDGHARARRRRSRADRERRRDSSAAGAVPRADRASPRA